MIKPTRDRKNWQAHEKCVLGISLHNPMFSGDKFFQIINWINEQTQFREIRINVADELNRHNYMMIDGLSEKDARAKARRNGDLWLDRHQFMFNRLNMPFHIIRWERWTNNYLFEDTFKTIQAAYKNDKAFRLAVISDVMRYFKRKGLTETQVLPKEINHSVNYILEELAVFSIFFDNYYAVKIYPAKEMDSFKLLRYGKVTGAPKGLMNYYHGRITFHEDRKSPEAILNDSTPIKEKVAA